MLDNVLFGNSQNTSVASYRKDLFRNSLDPFIWLLLPLFSIALGFFMAMQSLLMGLAFVFFGSLIIIVSPSYTVPVLLIGSLIDYFALFWGSPFRVFMFISLGLLVVQLLSSQENYSVKPSTLFYVISFLILVFFIPTVFSEYPLDSFVSSRYLFNALLSGVVAYFFSSKYGLPKLNQWFFILLNISIIFLIVGIKGQGAIVDSIRLTLSETINPNQLAINITYANSILLGFLLISKDRIKTIILFLVFCLGLYALTLTGSRTNIIATMVIFVLFLGFFLRVNGSFQFRRAFLVFLLAVIVLSLQYFTIRSKLYFIERYSIESIIESRGTHRFTSWGHYGRALLSKPRTLIIGSGSSPEAAHALLSQEGIPPVMQILPHNMYIQAIISWGLPGALIFFSLLMKAVIKGVKVIPVDRNIFPFLFVLIAVFFIGLGETGLGDKTPWLSIGSIFAVRYRDSHSSQNKKIKKDYEK